MITVPGRITKSFCPCGTSGSASLLPEAITLGWSANPSRSASTAVSENPDHQLPPRYGPPMMFVPAVFWVFQAFAPTSPSNSVFRVFPIRLFATVLASARVM